MRFVAGSNPAARTILMKTAIEKIKNFFFRFFNRKRYWEETLWDYYDYDWSNEITEPIVYEPLPDNIIRAAHRFIQNKKDSVK